MLRPTLNRIWGGSNVITRRDPGDAKYIQGWISEIPTYQVLNFLQYKMDTTMLAQAERGFFEWGSDVSYTRGSIVWDELDKQIYISQVVGPNTATPPSQNLAQWSVSSIQITRAQYDTIVAAINAHIANTTGNPHQLTPGRLGAYTKAEVDALVTTYRALVSSHVNDMNNPHHTTALSVGAVPSTGGTYTGDVVFGTGQILLDSAGTDKVGMISGNGLYLQAASAIIGINAAGTPVAGVVGNTSNIVTESTFASLKQSVEPSYASLAPVFYMPLAGDINIYTGADFITTNFDPSFIAKNDGLLITQNAQMLFNANSPMVGAAECTIALDISIALSAPSGSSQIFHMGVGNTNISVSGQLRLAIDSSGKIQAYSNTGLNSPLAYNDAIVHRVIAKSTTSALYLYVDGVQVASVATSAAPILNFAQLMVASTPVVGSVGVSNFRCWPYALSDKQISKL